MLLKYCLHVPVINGYLCLLEWCPFINCLLGLWGRWMERIFTSSEDESYLHHHCHHTTARWLYATAGLCSGWILGHAKLRKYSRNLSNVCHTAKRWIGWAGIEDRGGCFSWGIAVKTLNTCDPSQPPRPFCHWSPRLHWDSGSWWKGPTLPLVAPCWVKGWMFFFSSSSSFFFCSWMLRLCADMLHWPATEDADVIFRPGLSRPRGCIVRPRCHF